MKHYLAVLVPHDESGWRAHFPDFPGCRAEGPSAEAAIGAAALAAAEHARRLRAQGVSLPHPQTYEDVRLRSNGWSAERGIEWSRAVLSIVRLRLEA